MYINFVKLYRFQANNKLAPLNFDLFEKYLERCTSLLNERKNLTFDVDEIDVFGFLTDSCYGSTFERKYYRNFD